MKKCPCVSVSLWTAWEISTEMYYFYPPFESHRARLTASSVSCANAFKRSKIMRLFIHTNTRVAQMVICFDGMHLVVVESITLWPLIHSARLNIDCWLDMFMMLLKCSGNFRFFFRLTRRYTKLLHSNMFSVKPAPTNWWDSAFQRINFRFVLIALRIPQNIVMSFGHPIWSSEQQRLIIKTACEYQQNGNW